jgi:hypothetical protein
MPDDRPQITDGFAKLCDIVAKLRAPDGCPWDREQTNESLLPALIEEAYETAEAAPKTDGDSSTDDPRRRPIPARRLNLSFHTACMPLIRCLKPVTPWGENGRRLPASDR